MFKKNFKTVVICFFFSVSFFLFSVEYSAAADHFFPRIVIINGVEYDYSRGKKFPINTGDNEVIIRFTQQQDKYRKVSYSCWSGNISLRDFKQVVWMAERKADESKFKRMLKEDICRFIVSTQVGGEFLVKVNSQKIGDKQDRWDPIHLYVVH